MNKNTLKRANEIQEEIKKLKNELDILSDKKFDTKNLRLYRNVYKLSIRDSYDWEEFEIDLDKIDIVRLAYKRMLKIRELKKEFKELQ